MSQPESALELRPNTRQNRHQNQPHSHTSIPLAFVTAGSVDASSCAASHLMPTGAINLRNPSTGISTAGVNRIAICDAPASLLWKRFVVGFLGLVFARKVNLRVELQCELVKKVRRMASTQSTGFWLCPKSRHFLAQIIRLVALWYCNNTSAARKITARASRFNAKWRQKPDLMSHKSQIGTFGMETMSRLVQLKVFVSGMRGTGIELAKNLILAGPAAVTLRRRTKRSKIRSNMGTTMG